MQDQKAQGAIEYLLMVGAAILLVAIVLTTITTVTTTGRKQTDTNLVDTQINELREKRR